MLQRCSTSSPQNDFPFQKKNKPSSYVRGFQIKLPEEAKILRVSKMYTTLHYTTLHYTTLHYTTLLKDSHIHYSLHEA